MAFGPFTPFHVISALPEEFYFFLPLLINLIDHFVCFYRFFNMVLQDALIVFYLIVHHRFYLGSTIPV